MFSVRQKREISEAIQEILRKTGHPELPESEIEFCIDIKGAASWSFAKIKNNGMIKNPTVNPHNEMMDTQKKNYTSTIEFNDTKPNIIDEMITNAKEKLFKKSGMTREEFSERRIFTDTIRDKNGAETIVFILEELPGDLYKKLTKDKDKYDPEPVINQLSCGLTYDGFGQGECIYHCTDRYMGQSSYKFERKSDNEFIYHTRENLMMSKIKEV